MENQDDLDHMGEKELINAGPTPPIPLRYEAWPYILEAIYVIDIKSF